MQTIMPTAGIRRMKRKLLKWKSYCGVERELQLITNAAHVD